MTLRRPRMERDASGTVFLFRPLCFFPSFLPSPTRFVRPFFPTLVRPSREEFLKINIGAKRGGAAKKFDIPFASFLFTFLSSVRFFLQRELRSREPRPLMVPRGKQGYSNQLDLRGREFTKEVAARTYGHRRSAGEFIFSEA